MLTSTRGARKSCGAAADGPAVTRAASSSARRRRRVTVASVPRSQAESASGLVAYGVSRRTKEIGIRRAVGASATDVLRLAICARDLRRCTRIAPILTCD